MAVYFMLRVTTDDGQYWRVTLEYLHDNYENYKPIRNLEVLQFKVCR